MTQGLRGPAVERHDDDTVTARCALHIIRRVTMRLDPLGQVNLWVAGCFEELGRQALKVGCLLRGGSPWTRTPAACDQACA